MSDEPVKPPSLKWLDDTRGNLTRAKRSSKHETRIAKSLGGKRLPQSGAKRFSKWLPSSVTAGGDLTTDNLLIEHKRAEPETKSISVKREWLLKVSEGAERMAKVPAMVLTFEDSKGFEGDWLMVPLSAARNLLGLEIEDE